MAQELEVLRNVSDVCDELELSCLSGKDPLALYETGYMLRAFLSMLVLVLVATYVFLTEFEKLNSIAGH